MQTNHNNNHSKNYLDLRQPQNPQNSEKTLKSAKSSKSQGAGPGKSLLITMAVCFSVILGSVAYKIALAHKESDKNNNLAMVASTENQATNTNQLINNALEDAKMSSLSSETSNNPFAITPNDSASDRVAKSLFIGYVNAQQTGDVTDEQATNVAGTVISQLSNLDLPQPQYSASDVKIFTPQNNDQIKQYGNIVAGIVIQNYKILANNKTKSSGDLKSIEDAYINIGKTLIKQAVPANLVNEHLELTNSFLILADAMKMIEKQSTDPVQAMLGVKLLQEVSTSQQNMLIKITKYFESNAIIFTSSDVGALWNSYKNVPFGIPAEISTGAPGSTQLNNATISQ